jgi:ketosteroid isomerase-like protein
VTHPQEQLLRSFYAAIDAKDWAAATSVLTPDCRWHILANDVVEAASVVGPASVADWFQSALGAVQTEQTIEQIAYEGADGVAVFTAATVTTASGPSRSRWIDVFRFSGDLINEHVSVQVG